MCLERVDMLLFIAPLVGETASEPVKAKVNDRSLTIQALGEDSSTATNGTWSNSGKAYDALKQRGAVAQVNFVDSSHCWG